jgi:HK97 family phage prohead protease
MPWCTISATTRISGRSRLSSETDNRGDARMTRKLLTIDEFRSSAREGGKLDGTVIRVAVADPDVAADDSRKVRFVFSDGTVDRAGDSIDPKGWQTDAFLANPVALWAHDSSAPPIGRASNVGPVGSKLMGDIEFMPADISAFAESIYRMVKAGFVKAVSVGFIPLEYSFVNDSKRPFGIDFKKQELLEISVCPVPCNPNALQEAKAQGIDTTPLREWASKLLDEGNQILVPRNLLEETFRQAKTPRTVRQKYLAKSESSDWKVGASRDLPVDEADSWDGPAAAKRMLDEAGFDGDSPDVAKASRGFLIHDAANPLLRGSYKLPFADIIGGELKAIKAGVSAAKGRLDQTEAPVGVLDEAASVIDGYEEKIQHSDKTITPPLEKSGRRISSANETLLKKAMDHHESATKCIKDVLASNETDDNDSEPDNDPDDMTIVAPKVMTEAEQRATRLADAKALRESIKV